MTTLIETIEALFLQHGDRPHDSSPDAQVTALSHALQCAQLAEWADADESLVAAALLHDLGHFIDRRSFTKGEGAMDGRGHPHELRALALLSEGFGPEVTEPIRLHVEAKRYLVTTDPAYAASLSPVAAQTLAAQGGPMTAAEVRQFERERYAPEAVQLRRWDDLAKVAGKRTPPLAYYISLLDDVMQRPFTDSKIGIGSLSAV